MTAKQFITRTSRFLMEKEPFFFIINFDKSSMFAYSFQETLEQRIIFNLNGINNLSSSISTKTAATHDIEVQPFSFGSYLQGFEKVMHHLKLGNSFLVNLTFPSKLSKPIDLASTFYAAHAKYKLLYKDQFVCFSPECFIKIKDDHIFSYPMKGTIDASLDNAAHILLNDAKEEQEHNTIVDLIRNDISRIAKEVTVTKFRYLEKIKSVKGEILQTSTEIRGKLSKDWKKDFGRLLLDMLPAGSISGAPKPKTLAIIDEVENYDRGFYTGIFGIFDGEIVDSAVAIRFIEKENGALWYKSGGGITHQSNVKEEYVELIKKIYIPTF